MGMYAYKYVRDLVPGFVIDTLEDYEGTCDYDGDLWIAAARYIHLLEAEVRKQVNGSGVVFDRELVESLRNRPETTYALKGWD
jgi:hypothetical protein